MRKYLILPIAAVLLLLLCGCSEHRKSYEEGQLALQEERYDEAIRRFELAVSQGMKEPVVYADLAIACEKAGRAGDAEAYAAQAKEQGEEDPETARTLGAFYLMRAQDATALEFLKSSMVSTMEKPAKEDFETLGYIADIYRWAEAYPEAIAIYNSLIQGGYFTLEHEILAGQCYLALVQHQAACQYFDMAAQNKRVTPKHFAAIYKMLDQAGDVTDAEIYFERGKAFIAEHGMMSEGSFCLSCGRTEEAMALLSEADDEESVLLRAALLRDSGDYEAAEELYRNLISGGADGGNVYNAYLMLKTVEGDYTAASQLLTRVRASDDYSVRRDGEWNEIILSEKMLDFDGALDKMRSYAERYYLGAAEEREFLFLSGGTAK